MEELFFVIEPVWWTGGVSLVSLGIASIVGIFAAYTLSRGSGIDRVSREVLTPTLEFVPILPTDTHYEERTLAAIRNTLSQRYSPMHSWAHIPRDITSYVTDIPILDIINQLESSEYSAQYLTLTEREHINRELSVFFQS